MGKNKILKAVNRADLLPINKVEKLNVGPDDIVLVTVDQSIMNQDIAKQTTELMKGLYPDNFVLILTSEFDVKALKLIDDGNGGYRVDMG